MAQVLSVSEIAQGINYIIGDLELLEAQGPDGTRCNLSRRFLSDLLQTIQGNLSPSTTGPILARVNGDLPGSIEPTSLPHVWLLLVNDRLNERARCIHKAFATEEAALGWYAKHIDAMESVGIVQPLAILVPVEKEGK